MRMPFIAQLTGGWTTRKPQLLNPERQSRTEMRRAESCRSLANAQGKPCDELNARPPGRPTPNATQYEPPWPWNGLKQWGWVGCWTCRVVLLVDAPTGDGH